MRRKKANKEKHNTRIAIFFVIFVCSLILVSIALKTISVLAQSKFDGVNRFTISVLSDKNLKVVSFSPSTRSISVLKLDGEVKKLNISRFLGIPIDGFVKASFLETNGEVASLMSGIFFGYNDIKTNLNLVDIFRLYLLGRTTPLNNIAASHISISFESVKIDKIVAKLFNDEEIEKENKSVAIINTTSVTGLGGRLARLITNMGGNVIQVSTENNSQEKSIIFYNGKKTHTVDKLSKTLGFLASEMNKQSIADITIVIGFDNRDPLSF